MTTTTTLNTKMTPREADKLIASGKSVMVKGPTGKITLEVFVWRDRTHIRCASGKMYFRRDFHWA